MSKNKSTGALRVIRLLYVIDTLLLMPCAVIEVAELLKLEVNFWTRGYLGFLLPAVFLRIIFIPYIATPVLTVLYGYFLRKAKGSKLEYILFVLMLIICVLGLLSLELVFNAAMGI